MLLELRVIDRASRAALATHTVEAETVGGLERHAMRLQQRYGDGALIDDADADLTLRRSLDLATPLIAQRRK